MINGFIRHKLRIERKSVGRTQQDVADLLGKTRVAVSDMERGRVKVKAGELYLIARYLGKPIEVFFP